MSLLKKLRLSTRPPKSWRHVFADLSKNHRELPENKARETALRILLIGTTSITGLFFVLLLLSYFAAGNTYVLDRLVTALVAFLYMLGACVLFRDRKYTLGALLLVAYYVFIASLSV